MRGYLGDADYGQMAVTSIMTNAASGAAVAALQAFNIVIPGLGLVLAFAFKKLFGAIFADSPPDPEAAPMYALATQLQQCAQSKDYAQGASLIASNPRAFGWLHYATDGKTDKLFFTNMVGNAMVTHDWTGLVRFAAFVDASAAYVHYQIENERLGVVTAALNQGLFQEIAGFAAGVSKPGWATTDCYGIRQAEAGGYEAVTINGETGNTLVRIRAQDAQGGGG